MAAFQIHEFRVNESATARGVDLKVGTLPRISSV
jgi:hypothetical protein